MRNYKMDSIEIDFFCKFFVIIFFLILWLYDRCYFFEVELDCKIQIIGEL